MIIIIIINEIESFSTSTATTIITCTFSEPFQFLEMEEQLPSGTIISDHI